MASRRYAVFVRGINVGGKHTVPMAELREMCATRGYHNVVTLLQSGNIALDATIAAGVLEHDLAEAFAERFGFAAAMVARSGPQLAALASANPYLGREPELSRVHVGFAAVAPSATAVAAARRVNRSDDELTVVGRDLFIWYKHGAGRSTLRLPRDVPLTLRNWKTVLKMVAATA